MGVKPIGLHMGVGMSRPGSIGGAGYMAFGVTQLRACTGYNTAENLCVTDISYAGHRRIGGRHPVLRCTINPDIIIAAG